MGRLPSDELEPPEDAKTIVSLGRPAGAPGEERIHCLVAADDAPPHDPIELGGDALTIGRSASAGLRIRDPELSGRHCTVSQVLEQVLVVDLDSTNGTYIDGNRIEGTALLPPESYLQVGSRVFKHVQWTREELEKSHELADDVEHARGYVRALLPDPLREGPVRTEWVHHPCLRLGGDGFGYRAVGEDAFAIYLLDVSGHGTGASLHAVSVLNLLNHLSLPETRFDRPAEVLAALNRTFRMSEHAEKYLTIWYGVYRSAGRELRFASAGHPPAGLVPPGGGAFRELRTRNPGIGLMPEASFREETVEVEPGSTLYLYSDGAVEVPLPDGSEGTVADLRDLILEGPREGLSEPERIYRGICTRADTRALPDDCTLLTVRFP